MKTIGICLRTDTLAPTQYAGFDFSSSCVFNGKVLFAGDTGIFTHDGSTDSGTAISAYFQIPSGSADSSKQKRFRELNIGGYFDGAITVSVVTDEDVMTSVTTGSYTADNLTMDFPLNFVDAGEFLGIKFANVNGSDFSFDYVQAVIVATVLSPKTSLRLGRVKFNIPTYTVSGSGS